MDDDLRQKYAPRRNKRYAHLRGFDEEAKWADTLDWRTNEYDFFRLTRSIVDQLDSEYREKWGLCVAQLVSSEDIQDCFRTCRVWYEKEEALFQRSGIYVFLRLTMDLWLGGKVCNAIDRRREQAEKGLA